MVSFELGKKIEKDVFELVNYCSLYVYYGTYIENLPNNQELL